MPLTGVWKLSTAQLAAKITSHLRSTFYSANPSLIDEADDSELIKTYTVWTLRSVPPYPIGYM